MLVNIMTLHVVQNSLSVDPIFHDPREDIACANMFSDSMPWRAWDSNVDGSLDVKTVRLSLNNHTLEVKQ